MSILPLEEKPQNYLWVKCKILRCIQFRPPTIFFWLFSCWYTFKMIFFIQTDAFFEASVKFYVENMYFCDFLASDTPSEWCFSSHHIASTSHQHRIISIALCLVAGAQQNEALVITVICIYGILFCFPWEHRTMPDLGSNWAGLICKLIE